MKTILLSMSAFFCTAACFAQTDTAVNAADTTKPKSTLTIGTVYTTNASYYGQKPIEKTPYVAIAASYKHKSGFYLTGLSYKLLNDKTSSVSASSLGGGIGGKLSKRISADLNYSHTFYPALSPLLQAGNPDNASLGLLYENWLNFGVTGDYAMGKTSDAFLTGALSKSINLFSIGKKDIISINPSADLVAGTQHFYQTYVTQQKLRDSALGMVLAPIFGSPTAGTSTTKSVSSTQFNILSYNFKLPVAYNRSHYVIMAEYQLSVLSKYAQVHPGQTNSFLTCSFYYQF